MIYVFFVYTYIHVFKYIRTCIAIILIFDHNQKGLRSWYIYGRQANKDRFSRYENYFYKTYLKLVTKQGVNILKVEEDITKKCYLFRNHLLTDNIFLLEFQLFVI